MELEMADRSALRSLVDSLADGNDEVDWDVLEAQVDDRDRMLIQQLRVLAQVAEVHRSQASDVAAPEPEPKKVVSHVGHGGRANPHARAFQAGPRVAKGADPRRDPALLATSPIGPVRRWGVLNLLDKVGEGSFGEVYRALDTELHRQVAVKLLHVGESPARQTSQILREARALARVRHANVVIVHGAETHQERIGMWMEFIEGSTLEKLLKTHGPFAASEAARMGQDLCRALAAVHATGLIHRDIKAQNVMRETGGRVVLMDFGAGTWRDSGSRGVSRLTGTPLYLAPELLDGGQATVRSDIYSLGVLLYHLVTNDFPVKGTSLDGLRAAQLAGERTRLDDARQDLPDGFVETVERAIDPDPARRFASAGEMLAALRREQATRVAERRTFRGLLQWVGAHVFEVAAVALVTTLVALALWRTIAQVSVSTAAPIQSIAVVLGDTSNRDSRVLAAGFAEGLTAALSKIEALKVAQWSTTADFAGRSARDASASLRVDAIVQLDVDERASAGSGRAIDVRARILRAGVDEVGVESVSGSIAEAAPLQASLAMAVAKRAAVPLSTQDTARLRRGARPTNPEAYIEYVKGVQRSLRRDEGGLRDAVAHYERAIQLDPELAVAHAALSESYSLLRGNFGAYPAQLAADAAIGAASKAIALDNTLVDGWVSLGFAKFYLHWDWAGAEEAFRKAIALNPAHAVARHYYGNFLNAMGRQEEGLQQRLLARERDPNSLVFTRGVAWNYFYMERYADAARELEAIVAVDPNNAAVNSLLARAYYGLGRYDEGIALMRQLVATQGYVSYIEKLAFGLAASGQHAEARALLRRMEGISNTTYIKPYDVALVYVQLGEADTAMTLLERAFDVRDSTIVSLGVDPRLDALRGHPRFDRLRARMGY
jgi:tetratricopeptide (TPR) repeat protein